MSRDGCLDLPCGAMGLSAVCDCGIPDHTHLLFSFVEHFWFFVFRVILSCLFLAALWPPAGKGLTFWLSCMLCFCSSLSHIVS